MPSMLKTKIRQLDKQKPINQGLVALIEGDSYFSNADGVTFFGKPTNVFRRGKVAWISNGDDYVRLTPRYPKIANLDFTVRIVFELLTIPSNSCSLFVCGEEFRFSINSSGDTDDIYIGGTLSNPAITLGIQVGKIYDLVLRRIGSTCAIFLNGVQKGTFTNSGSTEYNEPIYIGYSSDTNYSSLDGYVYSFELYNRSLLTSEIVTLYHNKYERFHFLLHNPLDRMADIVIVSDTMTVNVVYNLNLSDDVVVDDLQGQVGSQSAELIDIVDVDDDIDHVLNKVISLSDLISVTDSIGKFYARSLDDTVTVTDTIKRVYLIADTVTIGEVLDAFVSKNLRDTLIVTDTMSVMVVYNLGLSDTVDVSDAGVGYFQTFMEPTITTIFGGIVS